MAGAGEWFWPRDEAHGPDGNATGSQVCWTNASLQAYMLMRAKECLRHDPGASIISISQLDNSNYCQDEHEAAIIAEEQSPAGPILRAVNYIADGLKDEFPDVLVSTLAYSYSRPVPVVTRPAKNVIVRFCTSSFDRDLVEAWSNITSNIFVWDYLTNFGQYVMPFPITFELGKDIRFLAEHGVTGYFGTWDSSCRLLRMWATSASWLTCHVQARWTFKVRAPTCLSSTPTCCRSCCGTRPLTRTLRSAPLCEGSF